MDTAHPLDTTAHVLPARQARRNILLLGTDFVAFGVGLAFLGPSTILPTLVRLLGGGPMAVGAIGTIMSGAWLVPQILAGQYVTGKPLIKHYVYIPGYISRSCLALLVPVLWWLGLSHPAWALAALLLAYLGFTALDALSSVAWLELLGRAVAIGRRGRFTGIAQALSGVLAIGAGIAVKDILARPGSALNNHILLIGLASAAFMISATATALVYEPRSPLGAEDAVTWREYLPRLGTIVRRDVRFAWLILVRWLYGLGNMAATFYALFAIDRLGMQEQMVGVFVSAGVAGSLVSGVILGPLGDRKGSASVMIVATILRCICPALALLAPVVAAWQPHLALAAVAAIFVVGGMTDAAQMTGFTNHILDIAPPAERALYIALFNTLGGLLMVAPLVAGWLVHVVSYEFLFVVALSMALLGLLMAWRGPGLLQRWWKVAPSTSGETAS